MSSYPQTNSTAKQGINYIKKLISRYNCGFITIHNEDDIGLDGIIEIYFEDGFSKRIAIQVKSGDSYFNFSKAECRIPVDNHYEYWLDHDFPVLGIVYVPSIKKCFWTDIKDHLKKEGEINSIKFEVSDFNEFNPNTFSEFIIPACRAEKDVEINIIDFISTPENYCFIQLLNTFSPLMSFWLFQLKLADNRHDFISNLFWKDISDIEDFKNITNSKFVTTACQYGTFTYDINLKLIRFDQKFKSYLETKFNELKKTLYPNGCFLN